MKTFKSQLMQFIPNPDMNKNLLEQALTQVEALGYFTQVTGASGEYRVVITDIYAMLNLPHGDNIIVQASNRDKAIKKALQSYFVNNYYRKQ